ncbi:PfkB family carbohydrate kinase [Tabrizicola sp.]|uniref:PfkB family carbohydrate kinase n=1 Tax=Tabrizicola sp. TaxID=2005166 RepID=UPI002629749E|nr:PfkB family carbohydrate kinase [Tabrizicola sp.]MDM7933501.1 PfkB family carbohydrate kinase [Tabrizicola sp.]
MPSDPVLICAGSLHHDVIVGAPALPRVDQTLTGSSVRYAFGGKGGNQAAAAARAGAEVHMAGAVGSDDLAMTLRAALDAAGVRRSGVQTHPGPSGMSVAISLPDGSYGAVIVSGANLLLRPEAVQFPRDCALMLLQSEISEVANLTFARRAREAGMAIVLNAAPARPVAPELLALTDLLVVNRGEAADILGRPEQGIDATRAAEDLAAVGPAAVIVTLGAEGLVISHQGRLTIQPAQRVKVVSSHGAGDAFIGALAAEWARGASLDAAAAFGQTAAALLVSMTPGERQAITEAAIRARM